MIPCLRHNRSEAGVTLIDLLVVISGAAPGILISLYFPVAWRPVMYWVLSPVFGIGFWCLLFLWWLPLIERRRKSQPHPDDDTPNAV